MDFITWWFDEHYILSTVFTTNMSLAWSFFTGNVGRGVICTALIFIGAAWQNRQKRG
jgi:hypothetical protein